MTPDEPRGIEGEKQPRVRRGLVDSVDLYEIKDSELDLLESGSPAGIQLNFAIFLLSIAFAAFCALVTATFDKAVYKTIFIVVVVVGILMGAYLLIIWWRTHRSVRELCKRIRDRIPPDVPTPPPPRKSAGSSDRPVG